ncbi:MAG TPA: LapA family protein [Stellaceae bacterium]|nr:LapA family protein [Stellaceae bacterium]
MRILWWIVLAFAALMLILFAVPNRETVSLGFWLLPGSAIEMPLYLLVLGTLILGFVAGQLVTWIGGWRWRREARRSRDRIATLERELDAERARPVVAAAPTELVRP